MAERVESLESETQWAWSGSAMADTQALWPFQHGLSHVEPLFTKAMAHEVCQEAYIEALCSQPRDQVWTLLIGIIR